MSYIQVVANRFFPSETDRSGEWGWRTDFSRFESYVPGEFAERFNSSFFEFYQQGDSDCCLVHINNDGDIVPATLENLQTWWKNYLDYDELQESLEAFGINNNFKRKAFFLLCLMAKDIAIGQTYDTYIEEESTTRQKMGQLAREIQNTGKLTYTYINKGKKNQTNQTVKDPDVLFHIKQALTEYLEKHDHDNQLDHAQWQPGRLGKKVSLNKETGIKTINTYLLYDFNRYIDWFLSINKSEGEGKAERTLVVSRMVYVLDLSNNPDYKDYVLDKNYNRNLKLRGDICKVNPQKIHTQNKYYRRQSPQI